MNQVILFGRLTKDPEVRMTQGGKSVTTFTVASNRPGKGAGADFINCVAWEQVADTIGQYFHKGNRILVQGRLQLRDYEDRNGQKRTASEVIVERFDFIENKGDDKPKDMEPITDDEVALPF